MSLSSVDLLVKQAERLPIEEQLMLMARLADTMRQQLPPIATPRKWHEIRGSVPMPLVGEDAQRWVSRTRQESELVPTVSVGTL